VDRYDSEGSDNADGRCARGSDVHGRAAHGARRDSVTSRMACRRCERGETRAAWTWGRRMCGLVDSGGEGLGVADAALLACHWPRVAPRPRHGTARECQRQMKPLTGSGISWRLSSLRGGHGGGLFAASSWRLWRRFLPFFRGGHGGGLFHQRRINANSRFISYFRLLSKEYAWGLCPFAMLAPSGAFLGRNWRNILQNKQK
jgi:hypothetical protein